MLYIVELTLIISNIILGLKAFNVISLKGVRINLEKVGFKILIFINIVIEILVMFVPTVLEKTNVFSYNYIKDIEIIFIVLIILLYLLMVVLIKIEYDKNILDLKYTKLLSQKKTMLNNIESTEDSVKNRKKILHDMQNHNLILRRLILDKNEKIALKYIEKIEKSINESDIGDNKIKNKEL